MRGRKNFWYRRNIGCDNRDIACHGFEQNGRQAVAVAIIGDNARQSGNRCRSQSVGQLFLRHRPDEADGVLQPLSRDLRGQGCLQRAITASGAGRVIVTHGYEAVMVRWLQQQGLQAGSFQTAYSGEGGGDA